MRMMMSFRTFQCALVKAFISQESLKLRAVIAGPCSRCIRNKAGLVIYPKKVEKLNKRSTGMNTRQGRSLTRQETRAPFDHYEDDSVVDYTSHLITTYGSKHTAMQAELDQTKELLRLNSFVREKTIENRYFKQPKNPNMLTWACKEQIRLLHEKDPELWSIETLAQRIPVSEMSVRKIIKSKIRLHRLVDIIEHDLFVKRNWNRVFSSLVSKSCEVMDEQELMDVLTHVGNAENVLNIFLLENEEIPKQLSATPKKLGVFSSIVKDALERKEAENNKLANFHQEQLDLLWKVVLRIQKIILQKESGSVTNRVIGEKTPRKTERRYKTKTDPVELSVFRNSDKEKASSYILDGIVYNEDGDFLYKIP